MHRIKSARIIFRRNLLLTHDITNTGKYISWGKNRPNPDCDPITNFFLNVDAANSTYPYLYSKQYCGSSYQARLVGKENNQIFLLNKITLTTRTEGR